MRPALSSGTRVSLGSAKTVRLASREGRRDPEEYGRRLPNRSQTVWSYDQQLQSGADIRQVQAKSHWQSFHGIVGHIWVLGFPGVLHHGQATRLVHCTKSFGSISQESRQNYTDCALPVTLG